ncbi:MAG: DUF2283 domain-containing protein [Candidatus Micrarchaeota archaeon]
MEKIKIIFDKESNTLDIWFDDPKKEWICEETGEELILKKDKQGNIIGIEKLNASHSKHNELPMELIMR